MTLVPSYRRFTVPGANRQASVSSPTPTAGAPTTSTSDDGAVDGQERVLPRVEHGRRAIRQGHPAGDRDVGDGTSYRFYQRRARRRILRSESCVPTHTYQMSGEGCRSDICGDYGEDCCAPGDEPRLRASRRGTGWPRANLVLQPCVPMHGESAVYQCCAYTSPPDAPPSPPDAPPSPSGRAAAAAAGRPRPRSTHASAPPPAAPPLRGRPAASARAAPRRRRGAMHQPGAAAAVERSARARRRRHRRVSGLATCGAHVRPPFPNGLRIPTASGTPRRSLYAPGRRLPHAASSTALARS